MHKEAHSVQGEPESKLSLFKVNMRKAQSSSLGSHGIFFSFFQENPLIKLYSSQVIAQKLRTPSRISALDRKDHQFYLGQATHRPNSKGRYTFYLRMLMKFLKEAHHANNSKKERKQEKIQVVHKGLLVEMSLISPTMHY